MRAIRGLSIAALMVLANVGEAGAQASRGFKDSWFWGAKAGLINYQVVDNAVSKAPIAGMIGADWFITRSSGGLYLSFDHSFFRTDSLFVNDSLSPLDSVPRVVQLKGLRRFTLMGMLFPMQSYVFHPYIGMGVTMSSIVEATPQGTYRNATQQNLVLNTIEAFRSTATPTFMLGVQMRLPLAGSAFAQATATPANNNFFLFSGQSFRTTVEVGMRLNAGTSVERTR
jgi:hypothetical protein